LKTGDELARLPGHTGAIGGISFSADGKRLVSASQDGTARIWNLSPVPQEAQHNYKASAPFRDDGPPWGWFKAGTAKEDHQIVRDQTIKHGGNVSALLKSTTAKADAFGNIMQIFGAAEYRGKRI